MTALQYFATSARVVGTRSGASGFMLTASSSCSRGGIIIDRRYGRSKAEEKTRICQQMQKSG